MPVLIHSARGEDIGRIVGLEIGPDDYLAKPFHQPSRNRDSGGTGLGLAIAKDVVEAHGGSLTLANRNGGGLAATIRIPR